MNSKFMWCFLAALPVSQSALASSTNGNVNEALYYYCQQGSNEYQEQVIVGSGQKVMYHQGPFMQITANSDSQEQLDAVRHNLEAVGVEAQCAQYLLSHATIDENDQWQANLIAQILFDFDKSALNAQSRYLLSQLKVRIEDGDSNLMVVGNTDSVGAEQYNLVLGLKRSQAVTEFLDIDSEANSDGELHPITSNDSEYGRHLNRRVEIELKPQS
ncbi:OmpA family protein [Vibrio sp. TBV020]|uniref:OmpA family protein n=1 Tax=Vibrio sp. TBV020 TaxID=3137398 RepID=UPI0038CD58B3